MPLIAVMDNSRNKIYHRMFTRNDVCDSRIFQNERGNGSMHILYCFTFIKVITLTLFILIIF